MVSHITNEIYVSKFALEPNRLSVWKFEAFAKSAQSLMGQCRVITLECQFQLPNLLSDELDLNLNTVDVSASSSN